MAIHFLSNEILKEEFAYLSPEERNALAQQLEAPSFTDPDALMRTLSRNGANSILNDFRDSGTEPKSYLELLGEFMPHRKLNTSTEECTPESPSSSLKPDGINIKAELLARRFGHEFLKLDEYPELALDVFDQFFDRLTEVETTFMSRLLTLVFDSLDDQQKQLFIENLKANLPEVQKSSAGLGIAGGALLLGNLGGFGTYMAMSSMLSVLSLGALPFGAYTAASSMLSVALGPVGWLALGVFAVNRFGSPNKNKITLMLAQVVMLRSCLHTSKRARLESIRTSVSYRVRTDAELQRVMAKNFINTPIPSSTSFLDRTGIRFTQRRQLRKLDDNKKKGNAALEAVKRFLLDRSPE